MEDKLHSAPPTGNLHSAPQTNTDILRGDDDSSPVILHPLVVINVSDHYTRFTAMRMFPEAALRNAAQNSEFATHAITDADGNTRVLGILLGTQSGRTVEICHSFELPVTLSDSGHMDVDVEFMQKRIQQYRQIFGQYNVVGWYCTGSKVSSEDHRLHTEVFSVLNEAPILLLMNPSLNAPGDRVVNKGRSSQPSAGDHKPAHSSGMLVTYQMELRVVDDTHKMILAPVPHRYASEDSERIAVDHVMRHAIPGGEDGTSSTALHLWTLRRSIKMLKNRMELLVSFLEATANGAIEIDHSLLRRVAGVCARLPAMDCKEFSEAFADERHDSLIVTYLAGVTKAMCSMNEAVDMFNRATERLLPGSSNRRRGMFIRA